MVNVTAMKFVKFMEVSTVTVCTEMPSVECDRAPAVTDGLRMLGKIMPVVTSNRCPGGNASYTDDPPSCFE